MDYAWHRVSSTYPTMQSFSQVVQHTFQVLSLHHQACSDCDRSTREREREVLFVEDTDRTTKHSCRYNNQLVTLFWWKWQPHPRPPESHKAPRWEWTSSISYLWNFHYCFMFQYDTNVSGLTFGMQIHGMVVCVYHYIFSGCFALPMSSNVWQILIQNANTTLWRGVSEETMTNTRSYDLHDHQWFSSIDTNNIIGQKLMNNNGKHLVQYVSVITSIVDVESALRSASTFHSQCFSLSWKLHRKLLLMPEQTKN